MHGSFGDFSETPEETEFFSCSSQLDNPFRNSTSSLAPSQPEHVSDEEDEYPIISNWNESDDDSVGIIEKVILLIAIFINHSTLG
jgi:hypothetical protein